MMAEAIKKAADKKGIDVNVNAYPYTKLSELIDGADVVLLGPQIRYKQKELQQKYGDKNVPILVINPMDYGMMDGEKVLNAVIASLQEK